jgi:hypothetical protein
MIAIHKLREEKIKNIQVTVVKIQEPPKLTISLLIAG